MPHAIIKMYPGRSPDIKARLAEEIVKAIKSVLGSKDAAISVGIEDVAPEDWEANVAGPDIAAKPETIFKRPG